MRASLAVVSILAVLALGGCKVKEYVCTLDTECVATGGGHGRCVARHCAYTDGTCATGLRFDDTAGAVAEECVDPALLVPDAGSVDASAADAPADDAAPADAALDAPLDDGGALDDAAPLDAPSDV